MKQRCNNPDCSIYHHYGGRGIKICDEWNDLEKFIEDMYPTYKPGLEIDRIDNDGDYEPDNCKWSTRTEQMRNIRGRGASPVKGVSQDGKGRWQVRKWVDDELKHIGHYDTEERAIEALECYEEYNKLVSEYEEDR